MKNLKRRTDMLIKWRFTEGRRARAVWIDGQPDASTRLSPVTIPIDAGSVRRLI